MAQVVLGLAALGLSAGGAIVGYRESLVRARRAEIVSEEAMLAEKLRVVERAAAEVDRVHAANKHREREVIDVVSTLWGERLHRYETTGREMEAYMLASPEGVGVLQGTRHHYGFLGRLLPQFTRFDTQALRIHALLVALRCAASKGLPEVAPNLLANFGTDPLVSAVVSNVRDCASSADVPASMVDLNEAFAFCFRELSSALDAAHERLVRERTIIPPSPSLLTQAAGALLQRVHLAPKPPVELSTDELGLLRRHEEDQRSLQTPADVRAALAYTDELVARFSNMMEEAGMRSGASDPSPMADQQVAVAVQQLVVWRESAAGFLLQRQAAEALSSYALCLTDTLTHVLDKDLPPVPAMP